MHSTEYLLNILLSRVVCHSRSTLFGFTDNEETKKFIRLMDGWNYKHGDQENADASLQKCDHGCMGRHACCRVWSEASVGGL